MRLRAQAVQNEHRGDIGTSLRLQELPYLLWDMRDVGDVRDAIVDHEAQAQVRLDRLWCLRAQRYRNRLLHRGAWDVWGRR